MVTPPHDTVECCTRCQSEDSVFTDWAAGDIVCHNCGFVLDESILDESAEWNHYEGDSIHTKQRTAGPVNPIDGTLPPTSFSSVCYGGTTNHHLRQRLARIQHVRDHAIEREQSQLIKDVSIDLAVRKKKKKKRNLQEYLEDELLLEDDDEEETATTTTDPPPPKSMVLIEEHMEQQIEREQAQLDERTRRLNQRKWTLRNDESDDEDDEPTILRKRKHKYTKKQKMMFAQAQETLRKAAQIVRSLAAKHSYGINVVEETIARFQTYAATNDNLSNAACAAIVQGTTGEIVHDAFDTTKNSVKRISKQIQSQFPKWTRVTNILDRIQPSLDTTTRDATLQLECHSASMILAAVYFCNSVVTKLHQLGLRTTTNATKTISVAQLAKQTGIPASRIRTAYKQANRKQWLEQIAPIIPQAAMVQQLLPNKAV